MKLYISTKKMTFNEDNIEHEIVLLVKNEEFQGYDISIEGNEKFIEDTFENNEFKVREQETWNSFPLYEIVNEKIVDFNWGNYSYFSGTDRRARLARKINELYNPPSEAKILRKTLKYIMDTLNIEYPDNFKKYNNKITTLINKNPKI
jgi:hypothetical protein